ncbi:sensor histidine kinase [Undibacterium sp. Di24W]|uniref:sensor histidine kinase n=1 Tax=Undibacterium sp. Di24W TaxID=3413033 RepID=UPI003BF41D66
MKTSDQLSVDKKSAFGGTVLFWALMVAVAVQDYQRAGGKHLWEPVLWESSSALVGTIIFYLQWPLLTNKSLLQTPRRWFFRLLTYLPLVCISFVCVTFSIRHGLYALIGDTYSHDPWLEVIVYESIKLSIFFGLFYVVVFGVQSYMFLVEEKANAERATRLLQQAHIQRLSQQIQPHFLFNALNTISSLMYSDLKAADTAITRLAELLRHTLDLGEQTETTFARELELLRAFAELMQLRFVDRVSIEWQIDPRSLTCKVPTMCLQVLLENTFKHTVEKRSAKTHIVIRTSSNENILSLIVEDNMGNLGQNPSGIGLNNLRQRLTVMYGGHASFQITQSLPAGVRSEIRIALQDSANSALIA